MIIGTLHYFWEKDENFSHTRGSVKKKYPTLKETHRGEFPMKFTEPSLVGGLSRLRIKWDSQVQHAEAMFKWKWEWVRGDPKQDGVFQIHIIWVFPKIVVPQNGCFMMENPIKMDDLGVPLFLETPIYNNSSWKYIGMRTPSQSTATEGLGSGILHGICLLRSLDTI